VGRGRKPIWILCFRRGSSDSVEAPTRVGGLAYSKSANGASLFNSGADSSLIVKVGVPFTNNSFGVDSEQRTEKCELVNQRQDVDKKREGFATVAEFTVYLVATRSEGVATSAQLNNSPKVQNGQSLVSDCLAGRSMLE
jgi:hypothetical protein